jgi:acetate---CoA ligase (ADP-forming)
VDLRRLLRPRSIAVFGGWQAEGVVRRCAEMGFSGPVWPVHPKKPGAFRSVAELPGPPDAAFVAVNREATVVIVRELAAIGAGGAVCHAAGFREAGGRGALLQGELIAAAGDMPILGPNCYGTINYLDGALLWFDQHGGKRCERGVAILTQSGNIGLNLTMQRRGLPIGHLMTLGNQAKVGLSDCLAALVDDPRVTAIGLHIEAIDDALKFDPAARKALAAKKPVVAVKAGRSDLGAALTLSHTASLAGADAAMDALLHRVGVARVASLPVLLETLKLLHTVGPLPGRDLITLSCSGGEAALIADAGAQRRLRFRPFAPAQVEDVRATLSDLVTISNPLDYHIFIWNQPERLRATFTAVLACGWHLACLVLDFPRTGTGSDADWRVSLRAWEEARDATRGATAVLATLPDCLPEAVAESLIAAGIVPLLGIDDALAAAEAAADIGAAQAAALPEPLLPEVALDGGTTLDEWRGKLLLAEYGVRHPGGRLVLEAAQAAAGAEELGYPVVVKAVGSALAHRSELGAVALGLRDAGAVHAAARSMAHLGEGLLVEPMVTDGVAELIVGIVRDRQVGLCLVLGSGGVLVELLADRSLLLLPTTAAEVRTALLGLKAGSLLQGFRGRPPGDLDAVVGTVLAVTRFAVAYGDRLVELDINPLIVRPVGKGAVAADVLIRMGAKA